MSEKTDIDALEELAAAIARLEERLSAKANASSSNDAIAERHATLQADISSIIRDLNKFIEGAERG